LFSEFYQPLDYRGFLFVAPAFEYQKTEVNALSATNELERVRLEAHTGRFDVGVQFRNVGELRLGVQRGGGHVTFLTQSDLQPFGVDIGNWHTSLAIDRLDNANFPRHGSVFSLALLFSRRSLGADTDYATLDSFVAGATSFGKNTLFGFINGGSNLGSEIPFYERVELGGFLAVSGADPGTIRGNLGGTIVGTYYRQVALMAPALGRGIYLGGSVETGGAWDRSADARWSDTTLAGSLFVGADTRFGPLYLAYGRTEHGDDAWYFYLGRRFTQAN
jgi:NTE family protein